MKFPKSKFGRAFIDEVSKVKFKSHNFKYKKELTGDWQDIFTSGGSDSNYQTTHLSPWRSLLFLIIVIIIFAALFIRLLRLQIIEGSRNRDLADSNRIQIKVIHAPRGVIYDRNGKILAQNDPGFRLVESTGQATKVTLLDRDQALKLEVEGDSRLKNLEIDSLRSYPYGAGAAHILGYTSEITAEELKKPQFTNYKPGDKIGRSGVEQSYEKVLKGIDGGEIIEVDAQGRKIRSLRKKESIPGQNLYLTVDASLQATTFNLLEQAVKKANSCCGVALVQDPNNGQILALVSLPSYDPSNVAVALSSANSPILNRAIAGLYPPGSTFKIASALAGLYSGKITPQTIFEDTGVINLGPFKFTNWYFTQYGRTEGPVDLAKAIKRSNDTYFYRLGQTIGETTLAQVAKKLGLGKTLGIDIPGEGEGIIPDNDWKVKHIGESWYPGDTLHMVIGQGFVLTTPLQIANLTSIIAASGKQYPPHLVDKITDLNGKLVKRFRYDSLTVQAFKESDLALVKQGLTQVPVSGGTAWPFFIFPIPTGGKTGTAEFGDPKGKTHAWYTSFAPVDNPKLVVTVLVEAAGEGSSVAAPVAKEIYRWYFSTDKNNLIKDIVPVVATDSAKTLGE